MIQQKATLEKEMILLKKNSVDYKGIAGSIDKILLVSKKIDELIIKETQKEQQEYIITQIHQAWPILMHLIL